MGKHRVIIAAGSNQNPDENLNQAKRRLADVAVLVKTSNVRITPPFGNPNQPDFHDQAHLIETEDDHDTLKLKLKQIEKSLGRLLGQKNSTAIPIDLDIIVWDGIVVDPLVYEHDFLKESIVEVSPELKL